MNEKHEEIPHVRIQVWTKFWSVVHDLIRLRRLIVLRSIDECRRPQRRSSSTSLQGQSATESLRASSGAAHARATWGHSREIGTHPKVYIRNPLLLCCARKQPDTLETDRPLWTPMLPQHDYLRRTIVYGQLDTLSVNFFAKMTSREFRTTRKNNRFCIMSYKETYFKYVLWNVD